MPGRTLFTVGLFPLQVFLALMAGASAQVQGHSRFGGTLSIDQVAAYAHAAGFRGWNLAEAIAVAGVESQESSGIGMGSFHPKIVSRRNFDGTIDRGLWQINDGAWGDQCAENCALDPAQAARQVYHIWLYRGWTRDWRASYNTRPFLNRLPAALKAAGKFSAGADAQCLLLRDSGGCPANTSTASSRLFKDITPYNPKLKRSEPLTALDGPGERCALSSASSEILGRENWPEDFPAALLPNARFHVADWNHRRIDIRASADRDRPLSLALAPCIKLGSVPIRRTQQVRPRVFP